MAGSAGVSDSGRGGGEPENSQIAVAAGGSLLLAQRKRCQALANRLGHQPPAFLNLRAQFEFFSNHLALANLPQADLTPPLCVPAETSTPRPWHVGSA